MDQVTASFRRRVTELDALLIIERHLEIGDTILASMFVNDWADRIRACPAGGELQLRFNIAKQKLAELLAHEARHGRLSLLNRDAPEIVRYERSIANQGRTSIYADIIEAQAA